MSKRKLPLSDNIQKYVMSLESEKNLYVTGSTILAMKGIITYEEYITNKFKKNIGQDILDKKFYLHDILGAIRGITRLKIISNDNKSPSVTMYRRMREEDREIVANGGRFSSDSEGSSDENPSPNHRSKNLSKLKSDKYLSRLKADSSTDMTNNNLMIDNTFTTDNNNKEDNEKERTISARENRRKAREGVNVGTINGLPDELLNCGDCGARMSSIQHLEIHLERCRGSKRKRCLPSSNRKRTFSHTNLSFLGREVDDKDYSIGELFVCDTEDGEVIDGWSSKMGAIPPGPSCPRCAFEVPTLYDLPLHQKFHTGSENLTCPVCIFSTQSLPDYLLHVEDHAS